MRILRYISILYIFFICAVYSQAGVMNATELINAINDANDGDTIEIEADEIVLTMINNNTVGNNGLPVIDKSLTIQSKDPNNTVKIRRDLAAADFRIFMLEGGGTGVKNILTLNRIVLENGFANGNTFLGAGGGGSYSKLCSTKCQ